MNEPTSVPTTIPCPFCGEQMRRYSSRVVFNRTRAWWKDSQGHRVMGETVHDD